MSMLSVVIPVFREGEGIEACFGAIREHALAAKEHDVVRWEFVLVDDGSPDDTWDVLRTLAARHGDEVTALRLSRNFGKEAALCAGLEHTRGDAVVVIDADLQHPPELIPAMVHLWRQGYEVVDAVKARREREGLLYRAGALVFNRMTGLCSGLNMTGASDYKLLDRRVVAAFLQLRERRTFYRGLIAWLGFRHARLPMEVQPRKDGRSGWSLRKLWRLATTGLMSFSTVALHMVTLFGVLFLVGAAGLGAQTLYRWFSGSAVEGFTTVILLQLIIGGAIMVGMGIIGEYLAAVYDEVKQRPRYVVAERVGGE